MDIAEAQGGWVQDAQLERAASFPSFPQHADGLLPHRMPYTILENGRRIGMLAGRRLPPGPGPDTWHADVAAATTTIQAARNMLRFTNDDLLHRERDLETRIVPCAAARGSELVGRFLMVVSRAVPDNSRFRPVVCLQVSEYP